MTEKEGKKNRRPKKIIPLKVAPMWRHIEEQAEQFVLKYRNKTREQAVSKLFVRDFLALYGIDPVLAGNYEHQVKKLGDKYGFIDFFLPGKLVIEFKSTGKDLDLALLQALDYYPGLLPEERPRYVLICDFARFRLHDLTDNSNDVEFLLEDLPKQVKLFGFLIEKDSKYAEPEKLVDIKAAELMGHLHDKLKESGYTGHDLEVLLVRLLFCLFADDSGIFEHHAFQNLIQTRTQPDGSNLFSELSDLFDTLDKAEHKRLKNLPDYLVAFPHVNGKLFEETIAKVYANAEIRDILLTCCKEDWSAISPAIFGSMFQTVMEEEKDGKRRNLGAHYTSETNILKLIRPLFLDALYTDLNSCGKNKEKLTAFHKKLVTLRFLDPACGCGNFLIIAYRELRRLELKVLELLYPRDKQGHRQLVLDIGEIVKVNVDQFFGIELEEFPAQIAQVALWLMDHLMNRETSSLFGKTFRRLPLVKSATITHNNSLLAEWPTVEYILGNPPFIGKQLQTTSQKEDMDKICTVHEGPVWRTVEGSGLLDYVAAWYLKAARQMKMVPSTKTAFVSTNSITQGEQVGALWGELFRLGIKIHFAHRTFQWNNEARGKAAVFCVIIGFGTNNPATKRLFDYESPKAEPTETTVSNVTPYLSAGDDLVVLPRRKPICAAPEMKYGSKPVDDGNFFFTDEEMAIFLAKEPGAEKFIRPILSSREFLHGENRWCLWLQNAKPEELAKLPLVKDRLEKIRTFRKKSTKASVRELAAYPALFAEIRQPKRNYVLIPQHTTESREYIPFGFFDAETIVSNSCTALPNADLYHFGVISSVMHMAWVRTVCGRIKGDYRYSNTLVYNTFPWSENPADKLIQAVKNKAQAVLDVRKNYSGSTLADLYDPDSMPPELTKAHKALDKVVDACYGVKGFGSEVQRVAFLFKLYEEYVEKKG